MSAEDALRKIQDRLTLISLKSYHCNIEEWLKDDLKNIQEILNEHRNREFKASEPDPFS